MSTENEIRALCMRVFVAEDPEQFKAAVTDLKTTLCNSIVNAENIATKMMLDNQASNPRRSPRLRPITQEQLEKAAEHAKTVEHAKT